MVHHTKGGVEAAKAKKDKRDEDEQDNPTDQMVKNECWLMPNPRRCKDYVPRWFYDTTYLLCKPYLYGGCGGRKVNAFRTYDECMKRCTFEVAGSNPGLDECIYEKRRKCSGPVCT
ncbi:hypothetical protein HPB51_022335 [Rhipicephalus microplus]|uniref:BPTI/Kunitz inhibitor domain-containing protein n=1 Tax=Rhipicephalus microplus TaxID=6941 RepID=A0A9J6DQV5_RHIMP|nr:hypothetical protein HPB51_022335 [Rhipicephalus microplus]